jgi:hypothetical protein
MNPMPLGLRIMFVLYSPNFPRDFRRERRTGF